MTPVHARWLLGLGLWVATAPGVAETPPQGPLAPTLAASRDGGAPTQPVSVTSDPPAQFKLSCDGAVVATGQTPMQLKVPEGQLKLELSAKGRNSLTLEHRLDGPWTTAAYLDPQGQLVHRERVFKTGRFPKQVAITHDQKEVWVTALVGPPALMVHNLDTGAEIANFNLGKYGTIEVIFNRDGTRAYTTQMETGIVFELDVATHKVLRQMETKGSWPKVVCLSADEKSLFTSNWLGANLSEIDLETGKFKRLIPTVGTPRGIYAMKDGKSLFVAGFGRGELAQIDLETGKSAVVFKGGLALRHIVGDEERGVLYISDMGRSCIWVLDLATKAVRKLAETDLNPNTIVLSNDGQVLFVSCRGRNGPDGYEGRTEEAGTIMLIDTQSGKVLDGIVGGEQPTALALSPDGTLLLHSDLHDNRIEEFRVPDTATLRAGNGGRSALYRNELKFKPKVVPKPR
jgi:DNA-binding beta-propeller fold protein YncE